MPTPVASLASAAAPPGPRQSNRDYWLCQSIGWGSLTLFSIFSSSLGDAESVLRFALAKSFTMAAAFLLSHLWRNYLKRRGWLHSNVPFPFGAIVAGLALMSVAATLVLLASDFLFRQGQLLREESHPYFLVAIFTLLWFGIFLVWTLFYAFVLSRGRAMRLELEKLTLEVSVKDAELRALQAQVNPHFFFNSLNSIRALIYHDADAAAHAVSQLAGMMRHNLRAGTAGAVSLAEELAAVDAYLVIEKLRFDERLQLSMDIAPGLEAVRLPPLSLQTLVENAIKHGVEPSIGPCQVRIGAARDGNMVRITIANQGRIASNSSSTQLGLANTRTRLALLFGPGATCVLEERDGSVIATMSLPQEGACGS